jgi:hypothetical protein
MNPRAYTSIASLAVGLAVAVPAALAAPPTPHQLTIAAQPTTVVYGKSVSITGKLTGSNSAGETIRLLDDPYPFGHFTPLDTTTTATDGTYKFTAKPTVNTKYMTTSKSKAPAESPAVLVKVAPRVGLVVGDKTPKVGQVAKFSGRVTPEHDGQSVLLQRRKSDGTWKTIVTVPLADAGTTYSTYSTSRKITRSSTWRVVKPADADHARGRSPRRTLTVHS